MRVDLSWVRRALFGLARVVALFIIFSAATAPLVILSVRDHKGLSPVDELVYVDYFHKIARGEHVVRDGDYLDTITLRDKACRGIPPYIRPNKVACAEPLHGPSTRNTASIDPPTYYWATAVVANEVRHTGLNRDFIDSIRLVGIVWAGAGLTTVWLLCRALGATRIASLLMTGACWGTNGLTSQWVHVTPHAADLFVGGFVSLTVVHWLKTGRGLWLLAVGGCTASLFKLSDINVALLGGLCFLLLALGRRHASAVSTTHGDDRAEAGGGSAPDLAPAGPAVAAPLADGSPRNESATQALSTSPVATATVPIESESTTAPRSVAPPAIPRTQSRGRQVAAAATMIGALAITSLLWVSYRHHVGYASSSALSTFNASSFDVDWVIGSTGRFFSPLGSAGPFFLVWAFVGYSLLHNALSRRRSDELRTDELATATIAALALGPVVLVVAIYLVTKQYVPTAPRYGISLFPLAVALSARELRGKALLAIGTLLVAATVYLTFLGSIA
ncbi:hypothetical protein M6D93_01460 [Jatrophihabitans telluris]|uniref:Glycosyltransferase RgtA/B/C/D-like domain-containing protein n=1 Tax=Jatrophihabitans telluris TaxID=2038343 RepID=A0ABY4QZL9_9ACTN|nr:hypothetical protein [Jatrophihabitans telluris]UQX88682.1 hypothetical protein M6D93_01460 [Jatrophihabitans telluris]